MAWGSRGFLARRRKRLEAVTRTADPSPGVVQQLLHVLEATRLAGDILRLRLADFADEQCAA